MWFGVPLQHKGFKAIWILHSFLYVKFGGNIVVPIKRGGGFLFSCGKSQKVVTIVRSRIELRFSMSEGNVLPQLIKGTVHTHTKIYLLTAMLMESHGSSFLVQKTFLELESKQCWDLF